ncbi:MAG: pyrroline-5-carboxylate reductase [Ekhidna sp.]|nr:pyrroline-5-carboxylate reductase [Ekhidna sp.]MBC6426520.1 pyrroline-5-carboxylate reductase [Ekhidna sp.]
MESRKIAIIGAGNLGLAIANGLVEKKQAKTHEITLTRRNTDGLQHLMDEGFQVTNENSAAVANARLILLCVLPGQITNVLEEVNPVLKPNQVLISMITGVDIKAISSILETKLPIIRAMPNTAIAIGQSMTCLAAEADSKAYLPEVVKLFDVLGETLVIEEKLMQAATVHGASGTAFFMRYLRAATQAGVQMGFESNESQLIAVQTAKGAASLVQMNESHPEVEIDKVTTPQGCTIEGLNEMEHQGFSSALIKGVMTSFRRITQMKKGRNE